MVKNEFILKKLINLNSMLALVIMNLIPVLLAVSFFSQYMYFLPAVFVFNYVYFIKSFNKIFRFLRRNSPDDEKMIQRQYLNFKLSIFSAAIIYNIFVLIYFVFINSTLNSVVSVSYQKLLQVDISYFLYVLSLRLSRYLRHYHIEYDFSMQHILSDKKYYRLRIWNLIMYREKYEDNDEKIFIWDMMENNRKLISIEEYRQFKNSLNKMSKESLEEIIFYDCLPVLKPNSLVNDLNLDPMNTNGSNQIFLSFILLLIPIIMEKLFSFILASKDKSVIINFLLLFLWIFIFAFIGIIIWWIYKYLTFREKRAQIDSFFYDTIKEELEAKNNK